MPNAKVYNPDLGNTELEIEPHVSLPDVSLDILQTLARLMAFDKENNLFRMLKSDDGGSLRVTNAQPRVMQGHGSNPGITTVHVQVVPANLNRRMISIRNTGSVAIYLQYTTSVTLPLGIRLDPNEQLIEDVYTGAIWGFCNIGSSGIEYHELYSVFL